MSTEKNNEVIDVEEVENEVEHIALKDGAFMIDEEGKKMLYKDLAETFGVPVLLHNLSGIGLMFLTHLNEITLATEVQNEAGISQDFIQDIASIEVNIESLKNLINLDSDRFAIEKNKLYQEYYMQVKDAKKKNEEMAKQANEEPQVEEDDCNDCEPETIE